jgi:hypothetical protein
MLSALLLSAAVAAQAQPGPQTLAAGTPPGGGSHALSAYRLTAGPPPRLRARPLPYREGRGVR